MFRSSSLWPWRGTCRTSWRSHWRPNWLPAGWTGFANSWWSWRCRWPSRCRRRKWLPGRRWRNRGCRATAGSWEGTEACATLGTTVSYKKKLLLIQRRPMFVLITRLEGMFYVARSVRMNLSSKFRLKGLAIVSSIRTRVLIQDRFERTGTILIRFKWGSVWIVFS